MFIPEEIASRVFSDRNLTPFHRNVFFYFVCRAGEKGTVTLTTRDIMQGTGIATGTVSTTIGILKERGYIDAVQTSEREPYTIYIRGVFNRPKDTQYAELVVPGGTLQIVYRQKADAAK